MTDTALHAPAQREPGYGLVSRLNHWIIAAAFLAALTLGLTLGYGDLARETSSGLRDWHKAFGLFVLLYGAWRVVWRLVQGFPPPLPGTPRWQALAAKVIHWLLLGAILAMPLSGALMGLARGRALEIWGMSLVPSFGEVPLLASAAGALHDTLGLVVAFAVALHIGAALKHHLIDRDGTLVRMLRGQE